MNQKMLCSITDGEQYDDETPDLEDGDMGYDRLRQQDVDDRRHDMETVMNVHVRACERSRRNRLGKARWLRLRCAAQAGHVLPDPRNQEQRAIGIELVWRLRAARTYIEIMEEAVRVDL